jgi:predicted polyphosphate/ATP-dependent NAD kinase
MSSRPHGFSSIRRLGLIVNPIAGLGGRVGPKGSDGLPTQTLARQLGAVSPAQLPAGEAEAIQRCLADILADVDQGTFHAAVLAENPVRGSSGTLGLTQDAGSRGAIH